MLRPINSSLCRATLYEGRDRGDESAFHETIQGYRIAVSSGALIFLVTFSFFMLPIVISSMQEAASQQKG
jgi:hypothetical protein